MYIPFRQNRAQEPFLSPLGKKQRSLPAVAAPLAVTAIGGIALVAAAGILFSGMANRTGASAEPVPVVEDQPATSTSVVILDEPSPPIAAPIAQDDSSTAAIPAVTPLAEPDLPALSFNAPAPAGEDGIAMLEVIPDAPVENEPEPAAAAEAPAEEVAAVKPSPTPGLAPARVKSAVNLRAAPRNNAEVLTVLPANAQIEAQSDCNWCAVTYEGRSGFVYKSFIAYR